MAPSRYESFGLIAIEAMRYGKAVIAGDRGGLAEIIDHGVNGMLINPDNVSSLESSLINLINDSEFTSRLSINARNTFLSSYTIFEMQENALMAYRKMMNLINKKTDAIH